jgi:hypothetical protein
VRVDLRELGRRERHDEVELGDRVDEPRLAAPHRRRAARAARLQPQRHAVRVRERVELRERPRRSARRARAARGRELDRRIVGARADRDLDLRQAIADRERPDELAQRHEQRRDARRQHVALAHVGDVARLALVEARRARRLS